MKHGPGKPDREIGLKMIDEPHLLSVLKEGPLLRCGASAFRVLFSRSTQYCN